MTIRLRPHHFLCILTYAGKGYSPAFTANMTVIAGRIADGEPVEIVAGPDDICAPLLSEPEPHCHRESVMERDRQALSALGQILSDSSLAHGACLVLAPDRIDNLRQSFRKDAFRQACTGCQWQDLCDTIARADFTDTIL